MKEFLSYRLDVADHSLWHDGQRVSLTPKAFAVLQYLVERAGRLVTQNELLEALWPDTFVQPEVLKSQILDVRNALGDRPKEPRFIETVPRKGYRFIAPVRDAAATVPAVVETKELPGRDIALGELRACLQRAVAGERRIVFVTGEQGIGKTTLVEAFLRDLAVARVGRGQCLEGFGQVKEPYYPVLEALGQLARGPSGEALARVLESQAPTWLIQLPSLLRREHRETLQRELLGATRERMIREICEALEVLTEREPLVLVFEDLHWADHSTVDLIAAIAYRRGPARLLVIGTFRPVDLVLLSHPLKKVSHGLKTQRLSQEIALTPLGEAEVSRYLSPQGATDVQDLARWIHRQTDGNPLFMVTVLEHLVESGHVHRSDTSFTLRTPLDQIGVSVPDTLRQVIELQMERLSAEERQMLEAASVHGVVFSPEVIAAATETDLPRVEEICHGLAQQHHIIRTADVEHLLDGRFSQRYEFVHAAFRSCFYQRMTPARRATLHRRCGLAIEALWPEDRSGVAAELAGHFQHSADWRRTTEYLRLAAKNAWKRFDYREALAILDQSLQASGKLPADERMHAELQILQSLATLLHGIHDLTRAVSILETVAERAVEQGMPDAAARALVAIVTIRSYEDCRLCHAVMDRLRVLIAEQVNPAAQAQSRAQYALLQITMFGWDAALAAGQLENARRIRDSSDRLGAASVLMDHSYLLWASSQYRESFRMAQECLPLLLDAGRMVRYLHGRDLMATNLVLLGEWGKALDIYDESIEDARRNDAPMRLAMPLLFKAWVHLKAMDYGGVAEMCETALAVLTGPFMLDRRYIGLRLAASAELGLGRLDEALKRLLDVKAAVIERPVMLSWYWRMPLQLQVAEACLAKGDLEQARLEAATALDLTLATGERTWQAMAWELNSRVALLHGDTEKAQADIGCALSSMEGYTVPLAAWRVHGTAARIAGLHGDIDAERRHLRLSREVILSLAQSLDSRPGLRETFLASPVIAELLRPR